MPLLDIQDLSVGFRVAGQVIPVIRRLSLSVQEGSVFAIVGESGCGKSVLASAVTRLLPGNAVTTGRVSLRDLCISDWPVDAMDGVRGRMIGYAFQAPELALNPLLRAGDQIMEPLILNGVSKKEAREKVIGRLSTLKFDDPLRVFGSYPHEMSGGMNQRVIVAAASILDPDLLILDEPTKGLDGDAVTAVMTEVDTLREERSMGVLLITHDLAVAEQSSGRMAVMYAGELVEQGATADLLQDPRHPYTRGLIGSLPAGGFRPIPGEPYMGRRSPSGCSFEPRCAQSLPRCVTVPPPEVRSDGRRVRCHLYA